MELISSFHKSFEYPEGQKRVILEAWQDNLMNNIKIGSIELRSPGVGVVKQAKTSPKKLGVSRGYLGAS